MVISLLVLLLRQRRPLVTLLKLLRHERSQKQERLLVPLQVLLLSQWRHSLRGLIALPPLLPLCLHLSLRLLHLRLCCVYRRLIQTVDPHSSDGGRRRCPPLLPLLLLPLPLPLLRQC